MLLINLCIAKIIVNIGRAIHRASFAFSVDCSSYDGYMSITWEQNGTLLKPF